MTAKTNPAATTTLSVPDESAGARLDKWLADAMPGVSRSRLKVLIEDGAVEVGGKVQRDPAYRLKAAQVIAMIMPEAVDATPQAQDIALDIIYEDDALVVVNKPAGMVVHPAAGNPDRTLVNALLAHCGDSLAGIGGVKRPGIVHRIDKDTSGLLVAAKTNAAHAGLAAQFADHTLERMYDALVWGVPRPREDKIIAAIGRSPRNRKKMAVVARGGKFAVTNYKVYDVFGSTAAYIQCRLNTGRTHQIRVHMSNRGHPLIGDQVYGGNKTRSLRGLPPMIAEALHDFSRQALHAATLGFTHPITGEDMRFACDPPEDFVTLRDILSGLNRG
jgi:23S rRNA pseudouridine1911/1915/1917 synthase